MTRTSSTTPDRLATRRRYRRLMYGSMTAGFAGWLVAAQLDMILLGIGLYWTGFLGFLAVWQGTSVELQDERDCALERRAASHALTTFAFVLILGWPTLLALQELGRIALPPEFWGAIWALAALYALFGVIYLGLRFRS